ncbi:putative uridine kinase C227.14 isoform X2 [Momordica charantia]|uniref:Uridine kinase C227.14 isoform X2 n=1 Tax=Momordica charantia TaxID=3673 RepID=A0A6J1CX03_MOMCH|nr:putative uridine kinase C227.14 isoform X2 [Momordica charantia]
MEASLSPAAPTEIHLSAELLSFRKEKRVTRDHNFLSFNSAYKYRPLFYGQTRGLCRKNKCVTFFCSQKREFSVVEGRCIDDIYDDLAKRILPTAAAASDPNLKHIVGLAGPPGSGKTTIASEVVRRINMLWPQKASSMDSRVEPADVAAVLPMDGFHLYRSQLDAMENPEEAHARRGAPWTFNPQLLLTCLKTLRNQGSVYAPSFDHGVGDPVEDDIFVSLQFIEIDINKSMQRVLKRHISTGKPLDVAKWRIEYNDRPNAELIMKSKKNADLVIRSIDF